MRLGTAVLPPPVLCAQSDVDLSLTLLSIGLCRSCEADGSASTGGRGATFNSTAQRYAAYRLRAAQGAVLCCHCSLR